MTTTIKITELTNIGSNLASSTVIPVVNMAGTPTTEKTVLGNIANVVLAGAGGNYVSAAKATTATTANTVLTNAQPNITSTGNLTGLTVSNVTGIVNFTTTANVTLGNVSNLHIAGGTAGQLLSTNGNGTLSWASDTTTYGNSNVVSLLSAFGANTITTTGNISVGNIIGNGQALSGITGANVSGFVPNANVANTAFSVAGANVSGFVANANIANTAFAIAGANVSGFVPNANVSNTAFSVAVANVSGLGNIATINLTGSTSNVLYGNGVFAAVAGGANTGNVTFSDQIVVGTGSNDGSGGLYLAPGNTSIASSAVQYLRVRGGDAPTHIHLDTGNNAYYDQYFGDDGKYVKLANTGNIVINSNDDAGNTAQWTFGTDSSLTLPIGVSIDNSVGSLYPKIIADSGKLFSVQGQGNTGSAALAWTVDPNAASQYAAVAVNRAGGDNLAKVVLQAQSDSGNVATVKLWKFDETGNLSLPGNLVIAGNANVFGTNSSLLQTTDNLPLIALSSGANGAVSSVWVEDVANVGTSNIAAVYANPTVGSGIVRIVVGQNGGAGPNLWDFGTTGNLTLPTGGHIIVSGGLVSSGASPAPTINGFSITNTVGISGNGNIAGNNISATGNISANNFTGNGGTLSNVATKVEGSWTLASGTNTVSINVPLNGTYTIWVNGNIPNGIVTYTATAVVTNTNVPVLGEQYAWYYSVGNALVFTSIPNQFTGTVGSISNVNTYLGNTANVFTFGITNNSGNTAVVNYGYTKL